MIQANKPSQGGTPAGSWIELSVVDTFTDHAPEESILPYNAHYNSEQGMGRYYAGGSGGAMRGGDFGQWIHSPNAGAFTLKLNYSSTRTHKSVGFRCVFRP